MWNDIGRSEEKRSLESFLGTTADEAANFLLVSCSSRASEARRERHFNGGKASRGQVGRKVEGTTGRKKWKRKKWRVIRPRPPSRERESWVTHLGNLLVLPLRRRRLLDCQGLVCRMRAGR